MSSRIIRSGGSGSLQPLLWSAWSTESVDPGAVHPVRIERRESPAAEDLQRLAQEQIEAARRQGYREGESAARAACRREVEEAGRQMALAVQNALREKARLRAEAEREVVQVAVAIARKILRREVRIDPAVALGLVKAAMETVAAREMQTVRTTPAMAQALSASLASLGLPEGVRVAADASLEAGGLIVETARGDVDASVETQLEEISRGLLQAADGVRSS
jgi:flagellar assembly protein FliH